MARLSEQDVNMKYALWILFFLILSGSTLAVTYQGTYEGWPFFGSTAAEIMQVNNAAVAECWNNSISQGTLYNINGYNFTLSSTTGNASKNNYTVGYQGMDANGGPNGTYLGPTGNMKIVRQLNQTNILGINGTFPESANIDGVCLTIILAGGQTDASNKVSLSVEQTGGTGQWNVADIFPASGNNESFMDWTSTDNGTTWTRATSTSPIFLLSNNSDYFGNVYLGTGGPSVNYSNAVTVNNSLDCNPFPYGVTVYNITQTFRTSAAGAQGNLSAYLLSQSNVNSTWQDYIIAKSSPITVVGQGSLKYTGDWPANTTLPCGPYAIVYYTDGGIDANTTIITGFIGAANPIGNNYGGSKTYLGNAFSAKSTANNFTTSSIGFNEMAYEMYFTNNTVNTSTGFVQGAQGGRCLSAYSCSQTFSNSVITGDLIVAFGSILNATDISYVWTNCTNTSQGSNLTMLFDNGTTNHAFFAYGFANTTGSCFVNATAQGKTAAISVGAHEVRGINATNPLDDWNTYTNSFTTTPLTGNITTTQDNDYLIAGFQADGSSHTFNSADGSYANRTGIVNAYYTFDNIINTAGVQSPSFTANAGSTNFGFLVGFRGTGNGSGGVGSSCSVVNGYWPCSCPINTTLSVGGPLIINGTGSCSVTAPIVSATSLRALVCDVHVFGGGSVHT